MNRNRWLLILLAPLAVIIALALTPSGAEKKETPEKPKMPMDFNHGFMPPDGDGESMPE